MYVFQQISLDTRYKKKNRFYMKIKGNLESTR